MIGRVGIFALAAALWVSAPQGRGGPPATFYDTVPPHDISVIQTNPGDGSTGLSLMSPRDLTVTVSVGSTNLKSLELKANEPQTVNLTGLSRVKPSSYTVAYEGGKIEGTVPVRKQPGQAFTFAIQADSHLDQNSTTEMYRRSLTKMSNDKPDFLVDLGDTFMTDKRQNFKDALTQYRAQRFYFGMVGKDAPVFLALGNHDGEYGWPDRRSEGITAWSREQRTTLFPPVSTTGFASGDTKSANYFDFSWGDAQIWVLDPYSPTKSRPRDGNNWSWTLGTDQYGWLKRTLEASKAKYRFVFIHHLVGGMGKDNRGGTEASEFFEWGGKNPDGTEGFSANRPDFAMPIHDLLKKYKVDVVFRGHDHMYIKQERDGIVYQLVPQPSHGRGDSTRSAEEYSYKSGKILGSSGYLRVKVDAGKAAVEYVKMGSDEVADRYEIQP